MSTIILFIPMLIIFINDAIHLTEIDDRNPLSRLSEIIPKKQSNTLRLKYLYKDQEYSLTEDKRVWAFKFVESAHHYCFFFNVMISLSKSNLSRPLIVPQSRGIKGLYILIG